ncbi:MAG: O-methyltransferase [Bacilli bacterium]|nr:O-methyltransferase [Bacilli bacterium]
MVTTIQDEVREIKKYATTENVPIMQDDGISFLTTFIIKNKIQTVLEIGTAIGYSAIMMALANPSLKIVSIERDEKRYLEAVKNIKKLQLEDRITLIFKDALDVKLDDKFDLIFIDAAKSQSIHFFEQFEKNLNDNGYIITDNLNFHGFVNKKEEEIKSRNLRALVRKIKDYKVYLQENKRYNTEFFEIGDGISLSKKINIEQ